MIAVSDEYKTAIAKNVRRFTARALIDYSDYNIDNSITSTITNPDPLSLGDQMADGIESPAYKFWSWSNFEWGQHLRDPSREEEQGALSAQISNEDGSFNDFQSDGFGSPLSGFGNFGFVAMESYPTFRLNFAPRTVVNLKAVFDDKLFEWAEDFDVNIYTDDYDTPEHTENVTGNTSYKWGKTISAVLLVTTVEIVIKSWNVGYSKAKVIELFTSLQIKYGANKIKNISISEETESDSSDSPIGNVVSNSINMKIFNLNNQFDNDNLDSVLYNNVIKNRRIKPFFWLNDLTDNEISGGVFYADQWKIDNIKMDAEVSGKDVLFLMDESEYKEDQFITPGADQNFNYTSTADFDGFDKTNIDSINNELRFHGSAIQCDDTNISQSGFGQVGFGDQFGFAGPTYCGYADKEISFNYTPGVSVTLDLTYNGTVQTNANIIWYINYKTVEEWIEFENTVTFTPENLSDIAQTVTLRAFMMTNNLISPLTITDIAITLSEKVTLYSLAANNIQNFDDETNLIEGKYIIDQEYADYEIPHAFFEPQSYRSILKKIVEAAGGRAYQRRDGYIIVEVLKQPDEYVKVYDDSNIFNLVQPVKPQTLYNKVTTIIYDYILAAAAEDVAKVSIDIDDGDVQTLEIRFDKVPCEPGTIAYSGLPAGVTVTDSTEYTWGVEIELTNASGGDEEFDLTIEAKIWELLGNRKYSEDDTESTRKNGVIELVIDNYLVQSYDQAVAITSNVIDSFKTQRRITNADVIFDPVLLLGDTVLIKGTRYLVNKSNLIYNRNEIKHNIEGHR